MTLASLLSALDAAGVEVTVDGDRLKLAGPAGALTSALRQAITAHKPALMAALTYFRPLDQDLLESEASRHSLHEIERRLARLTATAASPSATPLDRQLVRDWTAIHRAKLARERAA